MKARPILFSAPMVRALLAGTKTQTRRFVKPGPSQSFLPDGPARNYSRTLVDLKTGEQYPDPVVRFGVSDENEDYPCPYGRPGDRLWVREPHRFGIAWDKSKPTQIPPAATIRYEADGALRGDIQKIEPGKARPSLFMRQAFSRLTLEIVEIRLERLQSITEADAKAEGVTPTSRNHTAAAVAYIFGAKEFEAHKSAYATLWEEINGAGSWALNPWVWVVTFKRVG